MDFAKIISNWFKTPIQPEPVKPAPEPVASLATPPWMNVAISLLGTDEVPGPGDNDEILDWALKIGGSVAKNYNHDSVPWCGLFTAFCLKMGKGTPVAEPLWARNWAKVGTALKQGAYGAVLVFVRDGGGHVGFYVSEDANAYHVLGGNQSDSVTVTRVAKDRCIAIRWPSKSDEYFVAGTIVKAFDGKVSVNEA